MKPSTSPYIANGLGHFDVAGPELGPLSRFYASVFGWKIHAKGPGYALIETPQASAGGALVESDTSGITIGVVVPNLANALEAAQRAGGSTVMPATDNGWVKKAQVSDPAGNVITLIEA
jgi:predicted enzyme related to lactoylglutathione lyase